MEYHKPAPQRSVNQAPMPHITMTPYERRQAERRMQEFGAHYEANKRTFLDFYRGRFERAAAAVEDERPYLEASAMFGIAICMSPNFIPRIKRRF